MEKWKPIELYAGDDDYKKRRDELLKQCEDPLFVAKCLRQEQLWRTGSGEYEYQENAEDNSEMPLSPKALSIVIESAIGHLESC